jgi:hypothetical protein
MPCCDWQAPSRFICVSGCSQHLAGELTRPTTLWCCMMTTELARCDSVACSVSTSFLFRFKALVSFMVAAYGALLLSHATVRGNVCSVNLPFHHSLAWALHARIPL